MQGDSVMGAILRLPYFIMAPLAFFHYSLAPYFRFMYLNIAPDKLNYLLFTMWTAVTLPTITRGIFFAFNNKNEREAKSIIFCYFLIIFILSTFSLQMRHKTLALPFLFFMAGYGVKKKSSKGTFYGRILAISYVAASLSREVFAFLQ